MFLQHNKVFRRRSLFHQLDRRSSSLRSHLWPTCACTCRLRTFDPAPLPVPSRRCVPRIAFLWPSAIVQEGVPPLGPPAVTPPPSPLSPCRCLRQANIGSCTTTRKIKPTANCAIDFTHHPIRPIGWTRPSVQCPRIGQHRLSRSRNHPVPQVQLQNPSDPVPTNNPTTSLPGTHPLTTVHQ